VFAQLQSILNQAPRNSLTCDFLSMFCESDEVQNMFTDSGAKFYPVVVGQRVGIHRTRCVMCTNNDLIFILTELW